MSRYGAWFTPALLGLHVFGLAAVGLCLVMGFWQLGVYDTQQGDAAAERQTVAPVPLTGAWGPDEAFSGDLDALPVTIAGEFAPSDQQFWVVPRPSRGVEGAWLVAPVLVDTTRSAILVVRGWAPSVGPLPEVPRGAVAVDAVLQQGEASGTELDVATRTTDMIRVPMLINQFTFDLYSGYAIGTDSSVSAGLELAELPVGDMSWTKGLRNLAYALQWWVFGAFALFMWWRMSSESVAASRPQVA